MKKIEIVIPKCPEWFILLNEEECPIELPKVEDFFTETQLDYFIEDVRFGGHRSMLAYKKVKDHKVYFSFDNINSLEWCEVVKKNLFSFLELDIHGNPCKSKTECSKLQGIELELFESARKVMLDHLSRAKVDFNVWKLEQQEKIHTKWISTFAKLLEAK